MLGRERGEHVAGELFVEHDVPLVVGDREVAGNGPQPALLPLDPAPVVDELVAGDPDQPRDADGGDLSRPYRCDGGHERLGGELLGEQPAAAAAVEIPMDLGEGVIVERQQRRGRILVGPRGSVHDRYIVAHRRYPTLERSRSGSALYAEAMADDPTTHHPSVDDAEASDGSEGGRTADAPSPHEPNPHEPSPHEPSPHEPSPHDRGDGHDAHRAHPQQAMVHKHRDVQGGAARAAVFGISDGLVSNVALILGVAAASVESSTVLVAGVSGLLAGAASMAAGEYVSVKAQAELIERELEIERESIAEKPRLETRELAAIYASRGIEHDHAQQMARAVMADPDVALEVHAREELGIDPDAVADARVAALSSFVAFAFGAFLPLAPWFVTEGFAAVVASVVLGLVAALAVGWVLAVFTERSKVKTMARQAGLATAACGLTWVIGSLLGATVI